MKRKAGSRSSRPAMTALSIHECASKLYKCFCHSQQQKAMIIHKTYEFLAFPYQEAETKINILLKYPYLIFYLSIMETWWSN